MTKDDLRISGAVKAIVGSNEVVRVCIEDFEFRLRLGRNYVRKSQDTVSGLSSLMQLDQSVEHSLPTRLLVPVAALKPATKIATTMHKSRQFKQGNLALSGMSDPRLDGFIEPIGKTTPEYIDNRCVDLGLAQLVVSFPDVKAAFLVSDVLWLYAEYIKNPPEDTEATEHFGKIKAYMKTLVRK